MTNRQWLETLSDEEFADWCCSEDTWDVENACYAGKVCPHLKTIKSSYTSSYAGLLVWLNKEHTGFV